MQERLDALVSRLLHKPEQIPGDALTKICMLTLLDIIRRENRNKNIRLLATILVFFVLPMSYFLITLSWWSGLGADDRPDSYTALVRISGKIEPGSSNSAINVNAALSRAFADERSRGVILLINSPGGTPVQAAEIHAHILSLKQKYPDKVLVAVGQDMLASGAYLVATAADRIYVNEATMTGSIGVIMSSFNLSRAARKFGIYRRIITSGAHKLRMDPFLPLKPADELKIRQLLRNIHLQFIRLVKHARGGRLKGDDDLLFSGDIWTGLEAKKLGLVDDISSMRQVMRKHFGNEHYKDFSHKPSLLKRLAGSLGASFADRSATGIETLLRQQNERLNRLGE